MSLEDQPPTAVDQVPTAETVIESVPPQKTKDMKIFLGNLPSFLPANTVRKWVAEQLKLDPEVVNCRKAPKWSHAILTCRTDTPIDEILEGLNGKVWKKNELVARLDDPSLARQLKPKAGVSDRCLNDQVTPLWRTPYNEQLRLKQTRMSDIVQAVELKKEGFALGPIKASPSVLGYRNKCEFTIGKDREGNICIGFSLGGYREGTVTVGSPADCLHVSASMKALAQLVQEHLSTRADEAPVFDRVSKTGFWRLMMVRSHQDMLMVVFQGQAGVLSEEQLETELGLLKNLLASFSASDEADQAPKSVGSASIQLTEAVHHGIDPKAPFRLIRGSETLTEELNGLAFQISPLSFFQVNPLATTILYQTIKDYVQAEEQTAATERKNIVLLDLCCGTGTIGMLMADRIQRVIGVELVPDAVEDARKNAALNGIENVEFVCGKVEDVINDIIGKIDPTTPIAVVLDPPRSGIRIYRRSIVCV